MKFSQNLSTFISSKSNWTGMAAIIGSISTFIAGTIDTGLMLQGVFGGLALIFVKDAVAKVGK